MWRLLHEKLLWFSHLCWYFRHYEVTLWSLNLKIWSTEQINKIKKLLSYIKIKKRSVWKPRAGNLNTFNVNQLVLSVEEVKYESVNPNEQFITTQTLVLIIKSRDIYKHYPNGTLERRKQTKKRFPIKTTTLNWQFTHYSKSKKWSLYVYQCVLDRAGNF